MSTYELTAEEIAALELLPKVARLNARAADAIKARDTAEKRAHSLGKQLGATARALANADVPVPSNRWSGEPDLERAIGLLLAQRDEARSDLKRMRLLLDAVNPEDGARAEAIWNLVDSLTREVSKLREELAAAREPETSDDPA